MIPSEIHIGNKARLTVLSDGTGYAYGTIKDFDGKDVLLEMDSDEVICVPWHDIIGAELDDKTDALTCTIVTWCYLRENQD